MEHQKANVNDSAMAGKSGLSETAIFAGRCFWGVEYYMQKNTGVISTEVGYIGGFRNNSAYKEVCSGDTSLTCFVKKYNI